MSIKILVIIIYFVNVLQSVWSVRLKCSESLRRLSAVLKNAIRGESVLKLSHNNKDDDIRKKSQSISITKKRVNKKIKLLG